MAQQDSRAKFAAAFISLVEETGRSSVSVVDLTQKAGYSRKTFYRCFGNIDDVVIWYCRDAMRRIVLEQFPDAIHVKPHPDLKDRYADWPFYARVIREDGRLDQGRWAAAVASHFESRPRYYEIVFRQRTSYHHDLGKYLRNLLTPALRDDIAFMARGRSLPASYVNFLAEYHAAGIVGRLDQFVRERNAAMSGESSAHWNYAHAAIARDLEDYFMGKAR